MSEHVVCSRMKYPADTVIVHSHYPGVGLPSASPFVIKLETFLRMARIKYQVQKKLLLVSPDVDPVLFVLDLHMKYTVEVVPLCTYIVWFVIM